jgi:transposase
MARQTSEGQRIDFYRRHLHGETYVEIAESYGVSLECVRYWCQKQQRGEGVQSQWHIPQRGALSQFDESVRKKVLELKQEHPRWGPVSLRLQLEKEPGLKGKRLPSPASIGRLLHEDPENRRRPKKNDPNQTHNSSSPPINVGKSTSK